MYSEFILEHFQNPVNVGMITGADAVGYAGNVQRGDLVKIYLQIKKGVITDARFKSFGSVAMIASADITCDLLKNKTPDEALQITEQNVIDAVKDLPEVKIPCIALIIEAISDAVNNYYKKLQKDAKKKS